VYGLNQLKEAFGRSDEKAQEIQVMNYEY